MAKYSIIRLNKMTCGSRRGLVEMYVQVKDILPEVLLLPGTNVDVDGAMADQHGEMNVGIMTESGRYDYVRDTPLYAYPTNSSKKPIIQDPPSNNVSVLNEDQTTIDVGSIKKTTTKSGREIDSERDAIQLTPEYWLLSADAVQEAFNMNPQLSSIRMVFEFELNSSRNEKACLNGSYTGLMLPLNDIVDVCVKSMFKKSVDNQSIPGNLLLDNYAMTYSRNHDQYFVFEEPPIDICQHRNDAFAISQSMTKQPYRLQSTLHDQIMNGNTYSPHQFSLKQDDIETVLYKKPSDYGKKTYEECIVFDRSLAGEQGAIKLLTPSKYVTGISYNYIVDIEQSENPNKQYDNPTIYDNGDIFGCFMTCKNMYNSLYSMQMPKADEMRKCRTYIGVQTTGSKLVLKYYDDSDYHLSAYSLTDRPVAELLEDKKQRKKYPYQKIETYVPLQFSYATYHKSNLFSIKMSRTGLDDDEMKSHDADYRMLAEKIKKDVSNAMKFLADSITPANTQLFTTYFLGKDE